MNAKDEEEIEKYVDKYFIDKVNIIYLKEAESPFQDWLDYHEAIFTNCRGKLAQWHGEQAEILKQTRVAEEMLPRIEDITKSYKSNISTFSCMCGCADYYEKEGVVYCKSCKFKPFKTQCVCGKEKRSNERYCFSCDQWELGGF